MEVYVPLWCVRTSLSYVQLSYGKEVIGLFLEVTGLYK